MDIANDDDGGSEGDKVGFVDENLLYFFADLFDYFFVDWLYVLDLLDDGLYIHSNIFKLSLYLNSNYLLFFYPPIIIHCSYTLINIKFSSSFYQKVDNVYFLLIKIS